MPLMNGNHPYSSLQKTYHCKVSTKEVCYLSVINEFGKCLTTVQCVFKAGMWPLATCAWFIQIVFVHAMLCVCVPVPKTINNYWRE